MQVSLKRAPAKLTNVALVRGETRPVIIRRALELISGDIDLSGKERIFIKPNFVVTNNQLASTHVEAVDAVLQFIRDRTAKPITIGESPAIGSASAGYSNYGYLGLAKKYGVRLIELDKGSYVPVKALSAELEPMDLHLSRTVLESDYRVSVCPMKTHNNVFVTLSLKNVAVGSLRSKSSIHQGCQAINLNLYRLASVIAPQLSVIDGFRAMEGNGPDGGTAVDLKTVVTGTDFLATDTAAATIMGFDPDSIGYLHYCSLKGLGAGDIDNINFLGQKLSSCTGRRFKPHSNHKSQAAWRVANVERFL